MSILSFLLNSLLRSSGRTTVIPDGNTQPLTSDFDRQRFVLEKDDESLVDGAAVLTIDDDRVSFRNEGTAETTGDTATIDVQGDRASITNRRHGEILAEDTAIDVSGRNADIRNSGLIDGGINGVNFANGGESSGRLTNFGTIQSDSRAVNIGGDGISIRNFGDILGTGNQRNGTVYSDATAEDYSIFNAHSARIDAGESNQGAGIALQTGDREGDVVRAEVTNFGDIAGRGQGAADTGLAGDGIRIFSGVEGGGTTFRGDIRNFGDVTSESNQGPTAAIRIADGVGFDGQVFNSSRGVIDGANNGLYFGDAEHDAQAVNFGTIQSGSRAVNIDGSGVELNNFGDILGTGDQRNGTVYSDATAEDYSITNFGRIDAGDGNQGAGIALQTGESAGDRVDADVTNNGTIDGRGQAAADSGLAGDGIRIFPGAGGGTTFRGDIRNSGEVTSESTVGATSAIRIADGVGLDGRILNSGKGLIDGANNGLYFGDAEHDAEAVNRGTIQSGSRAVNIDGSGVTLVNHGDILGTGNQRNGTVYADATAEDFSIINARSGLIDAGEGNQGSGIALQIGEVDGDVVEASVVNHGTIRGRGDAVGNNLEGNGIRLFPGADGSTTFQGNIDNRGRIEGSNDGIDFDDGIGFDGDIVNRGDIEADDDGIELNDISSFTGSIQNRGTITADRDGDGNGRSINAERATVDLAVDNRGTLDGDVVLGSGNDTFDGADGVVDGVVDGGAGDDEISVGDGDEALVGGLGNDTLNGGDGTDTASYDDIDVAAVVDLTAGTATRETGFRVSIQNQPLVNPNAGIGANAIVAQAALGNLYINIHTSDFPGGELRGNLTEIVSDETVGGVRTLVVRSDLNGESEVQDPPVETDASGTGTVTFVVATDGSVTYDLDIVTSGLNTADLLPVNIGNGTLSPIHLHNAPPGANGPVVVDVASDAGFDVANGEDAFALAAGFELVSETDSLESIENVVGSNDADTITGDSGANRLEGLDGGDELLGGGGNDTLLGGFGDDTLAGGGGTDVIDGGDGSDTNSFFNINATAPDPTVAGVAVELNADGSGTASYTVAAGPAAGNVVNESFTGIENITGSNNDDRIIANGAAANRIDGGDGDDFIAGGGGTDVLSGGEGNDTNSFITILAPTAEIVADLATGNASYQPNVAAGVTVFERFEGFENLDGSNQSDQLFGDGAGNVLTGNDGEDLLVGRGGGDTLEGGDGNDTLEGGGGTDVIDGGDGIDTNSFNGINANAPDPSVAGVTATINADGSGTAQYTVAQGPAAGTVINESFANIENLTGSENDDFLTGNSQDNVLAGGLGADTLIGGGGNDVLRGDELGSGTAVVVTATNELAPGGTSLTPIWFGFHDGAVFDLFDEGAAASTGLERLAEDGSIEGIAAEFNAQVGANGVDSTILGASGFIAPGETASQVIDVPELAGQAFFTWGTMVIPSNDAFLAAPDDPLADPLFDAEGNFLGLNILRSGTDVLDAGTEVNNELDAAFLNQTAPDTGTDENGVVAAHPGFNGSAGNPAGTPVNILDPAGAVTPGGTLDPAVADFTADDDPLLTITVERLASFGVSDTLDGGAGEDTLDGGGGNDVLTGGSEADTFVFINGTNEDTVTDYEDGIDRLEVSAFFDDAADAVAAARQDGADTVIDLDTDAGDSVRLTGIDVNQIDETDFLV